jgi:hypothetical protein
MEAIHSLAAALDTILGDALSDAEFAELVDRVVA